jgi:hypothetical protein
VTQLPACARHLHVSLLTLPVCACSIAPRLTVQPQRQHFRHALLPLVLLRMLQVLQLLVCWLAKQRFR